MSDPTSNVIGIFGGSGFYDLLDNVKEIEVETEYGQPSDKIMVGEYEGRKLAFLPRHSKEHHLPPHKIPYKANIAAFKKLGVSQIIAPCAAGSLQAKIKPGDFVVLDQFVDRTYGRDDTFYHGPKVVHIAGAQPYCPTLRPIAVAACQKNNIKVHDGGTVVVVNGPRFSAKAESRWFAGQGWEVINMTQYPEVILAREMEICYCGIALITDFDAGLEGLQDIYPVVYQEVLKVFKENNEKIKKIILEMVKNLPPAGQCSCNKALAGASF